MLPDHQEFEISLDPLVALPCDFSRQFSLYVCFAEHEFYLTDQYVNPFSGITINPHYVAEVARLWTTQEQAIQSLARLATEFTN